MSTIPRSPVKAYPLATKSQEHIPHELTAPAGCYKVVLQAGASYVIEAIERTPIVSIMTDQTTVVTFTNSLVPPSAPSDSLLEDAMVCPPGVTAIAALARDHLALLNDGANEATVYVQLLHSWNILGTDTQTTRI